MSADREPFVAIRKPPERVARHCTPDCLHSKECESDLLERLKTVGLACVHCGHIFEVGDLQIGAGEGNGQSFQCEHCFRTGDRQ